MVPLIDGDQEVGFYFKGKGEFSLPIDQVDELTVVRFNLARNTKVKLRQGIGDWFLDIPISELNFLHEGLKLPAFESSEAVISESIPGSMEAFQKKYLMAGWCNRSYVMLTARHNFPAQAAWYLNILGDKGLWEFARDPWTARSEQLWFARPRSSREGKHAWNDLVLAPISVRNLGTPPRRPVMPPFVLKNLNLEMQALANGTGSYVATETFFPSSAGMKMMRLKLDNTILDGSTGGIILHRLHLKKVTQDGQPLRFDHRENEILLELLKPTELGNPLQLRFEVEGDFLVHPDGDNRWELGNETWFPSTELEGMRFTATAKIRSEKPFIPLATGQVVSQREEGDFHILETKLDQPTWSFFIVAGKYLFEEETRNGLKVRVASYAHKSSSDRKLAKLVLDIAQYYENILGPFPVKELNVVQRNEWGSGQAPNGFLFITNEAFNPQMGLLNQWFSQGINQRYAHEIAHQYWGNQVLIASAEENWISEAFAQYCSAFVIRSGKGESDFNHLMAEWTTRSRDQAEWGTIPTLARTLALDDGPTTYRIRWSLLYGKGAVLLNKIHKEIGDQAFVTLMRSFQKSVKGRPGTTQDLINLLKIIAKKDYTPFFEKYLWGTAMPD
ncbi:MAG: M1 family aminopeptidase [Holophaga sp.]|nr:M1 family aminopeptidase [Holophaga sp.]